MRRINSLFKNFLLLGLLSLIFIPIWILQRAEKDNHLFQISSVQAECWTEVGGSNCGDGSEGSDSDCSVDCGGCMDDNGLTGDFGNAPDDPDASCACNGCSGGSGSGDDAVA